MYNRSYYVVFLFLFVILSSSLKSHAAFPPAGHVGLSMQHLDRETLAAPVQAEERFDFINGYSSNQVLPAPAPYYQRENPGRVTTGRILTLVGGVATIVGAVLLVKADENSPSYKQQRAIGWATIGGGTVLFCVGLGISGDKRPNHHYRFFGRPY